MLREGRGGGREARGRRRRGRERSRGSEGEIMVHEKLQVTETAGGHGDCKRERPRLATALPLLLHI